MKNVKVLMCAVMTIVLLTGALIKCIDNDNLVENDATKFKNEYEILNGKKKNQSNDTHEKITIPSTNLMIYASYNEVEELITKGTGVIYFGFPECPWCRAAVPVLIDAANEVGLDKIYYFNALKIRDKKHLNEFGEIITDEEGTAEYTKLIQLLYDYLGEYEGLDNPNVKRLYFPTVVFVKDGHIIGTHIGTLDSHDDVKNSLNELQYNELREIYMEYILEVLGIICNEKADVKC